MSPLAVWPLSLHVRQQFQGGLVGIAAKTLTSRVFSHMLSYSLLDLLGCAL